MSQSAKWYVLHTYSGYENAVKNSILKFAASQGMQDMILRIEIPMEVATELSESGVEREFERKVFPGYALIQMVLTDNTWHLVRNVRGVTGFVGVGNKPIPLTEDEVYSMGIDEETLRARELAAQDGQDAPKEEAPKKREITLKYGVGDHVKIVSGPFANFGGVVEEIHPDENRVVVIASMFNRETPVELELGQIELEAI